VTYDDAVAELYQAPHADFVATRKRLAGELKATDKVGAGKLGKLGRPNISAWVVNQLFWQARELFDRLLETAAQIRAGDMAASAEHRDAITKLRQRATKLLEDAGHGATEGTLRKVATTLSALAVAGGFDPDPPGALADDRDPPGFDAIMGGVVVPVAAPPVEEEPSIKEARARKKEADEQAARDAASAQARRKAEEAERARKNSERNRLETALRTAKADAVIRGRNIEALRDQLAEAERLAAKANQAVEEIQAELDAVDS